MHPGSFQAVFLLKDCVGDDKLALCAELEQEVPIVITITNAMSSKDSLPHLTVLPNSSIEVAKDKDLVIFRSVVRESVQIRIEDGDMEVGVGLGVYATQWMF